MEGVPNEFTRTLRGVTERYVIHGALIESAEARRLNKNAANLQKANLMMANLQKANLLDGDLRGANLLGANLFGAILIKTKFGNATWTDGRVCAPDSVGECL